MCFYYDDYPDFSNAAAVKARKPHRCSACQGTIAPGEDYERCVGKTSGDFWEYKLCRRCCYDRKRVVEHEQAEGCSWYESWPAVDDLIEYLEESGLGRTRAEDVSAGFRVGDMPEFRKPSAVTVDDGGDYVSRNSE